MKLKSLFVEKYKNLIDFNVDFEAGNALAMLVGNNGSGKSNVLEAISGIFHDLYKEKSHRKINCNYILEYSIDDKDCKIENKSGTLRCYGENPKSRGDFIAEYAPTNIIGLYSGEDDRLWTQFYESYYKCKCQVKMYNFGGLKCTISAGVIVCLNSLKFAVHFPVHHQKSFCL